MYVCIYDGMESRTRHLNQTYGIPWVLHEDKLFKDIRFWSELYDTVHVFKKGSNSDAMWNFAAVRGMKPDKFPRKNKQTKSRERYDVTISPCDLIFGMHVVKT